mgnify:CR=1 FL=1
MTTLTVNTQPTPDLNISKLNIDLQDFDAHNGVSFFCTFLNSYNSIIDRRTVTMDGTAWQNWGSTNDPQTDYDYVINYCLNELGLKRASS